MLDESLKTGLREDFIKKDGTLNRSHRGVISPLKKEWQYRSKMGKNDLDKKKFLLKLNSRRELREINTDIPVNRQMSLEEYKAYVLEYLLKIPPNAIQVAIRLVKEYEDDISFEYNHNSDPRMVAIQIAYNFL